MKWQWLVAPGSAIYLVPLVLLAGAAVVLRDRSATRAVLRWWAAVAGVCLLVAASKIAFYGWGTGVRAWDLTCFSGHTALSLAVWPVVLMLLAPQDRPGWRATAALAGTAFAGLIGYSRIPLGAHPVSEVIAGLLLGGLGAALGLRAMWRRSLHGTFLPAIVLAIGVSVVLPPDRVVAFSSEKWFKKIGTALAGTERPYSRKKWRLATVTTTSRGLHM